MSEHVRSLATAFLAISAWIFTTGFTVPDTVERDRSLPIVELNGYPFHAETFGDPDHPVVIVLHGGPGADYRYLYALKALASDHLVVFYDQRGTGLSPRVPAEEITLQVFLDDLDAFVTAFGRGRPVHLVGHSWGAMLASAYAGAHPDKVGKMVLAEPAFLDASTMTVLGSSGWPGMAVLWGFAKAWISQWFVRTNGDDYARDDFFLLQVMPLMQGAGELCDGKLPPLEAWRFGSPNFKATLGRISNDPEWAATLDFRKGVDRFRGDTLFLVGECNKVVGAAHQAKHMEHFMSAKLEVVPSAGHFMFNDRPDYSVSILQAFLAEKAPDRIAN
ncbi:alpha/beta fold hydrolase [Piscinibacter sp.]|uniref:alpha/beta fold hydrolase n=1 Tax=Piscinibacter sp. TaxID=1903157 RepID=UPI002C877C44|nr:alpha/beta hydrolase [Albitalea sp.]HUG20933.1 alpha/beta hydrolase [Albitalea sp.]